MANSSGGTAAKPLVRDRERIEKLVHVKDAKTVELKQKDIYQTRRLRNV